MSTSRPMQQRKLLTVLSNTIYDIPSWARGLMVVAGLAGLVLVVVGSLNGGQEYTIGVDKLLHAGGYATLAVIFVLGLRPALFLPALLMLAGVGVAIEFLQPFNARSFDMGDVIANLTGLAVGTVAGLVIRTAIRLIHTRLKQAKLQQQRRTYGKGAVILKQGSPVQNFCVIERGQVQVSRDMDGNRHTLGTMGPGEVFGLLGVLQAQPQYSTIEAVTETTVYTLNLDDLIKPNDGQGDPVESVLAVMAKHLRLLADRVVEVEKSVP